MNKRIFIAVLMCLLAIPCLAEGQEGMPNGAKLLDFFIAVWGTVFFWAALLVISKLLGIKTSIKLRAYSFLVILSLGVLYFFLR